MNNKTVVTQKIITEYGPPKIKSIPKKIPSAEKEKPKTEEQEVKKKVSKLKEDVEDWYKTLEEMRQKYFTTKDQGLNKQLSELKNEDAIFLLFRMGDGPAKGVLDLLDFGEKIVKKTSVLHNEIIEKDLLTSFVGNEDYLYTFVLYGNSLAAIVETVNEKLYRKKPSTKEFHAAIKEWIDKWKEEELVKKGPTISTLKGPMPSEAEQLEFFRQLKNKPPLKEEPSKKERLESLEQLIYLIPFVGPTYSIITDTKSLKEVYKNRNALKEEIKKKEEYLKKNSKRLTSEERSWIEENINYLKEALNNWGVAKGWGVLALDIAFLGLDAVFIGSFLVKSSARLTGRDALALIKKEAAAGKMVTSVEKDLFVKAMKELTPAEKEHILKLAKEKGSMGKVFEEMARNAGEKEITVSIMKDYLKMHPISKVSKFKKIKSALSEFLALEDGLGILSKNKFRSKVIATFYKDLLRTIDFKTMDKLSDIVRSAKLNPQEERYAIHTIINSALCFDSKPTVALLNALKDGKITWKELINKIIAKEKELAGKPLLNGESSIGKASREVLKEILPEYKSAYQRAPFDHWIKLGLFMIGGHVGFTALGNYLRAREEKEKKEVEKELNNLTNSETTESIIEMFTISQMLMGERI